MLANVIAFQVGWFACVLGAALGWPLIGTAVALAIVAWHVRQARPARAELALILIAAAIGALFDSVLTALRWIVYPIGTLIPGTAPYWIVMLWMLFATTLNVSLSWLKHRLAVAIVFGAIGGPLAYLGGAKLGALELANRPAALLALALGWAILMPMLLAVASRYDGYAYRRVRTR